MDLTRLLYVNAYQTYLNTLHGGCSAAMTEWIGYVLRTPRPGHLVMEISTIYMPERDAHRFGRLLSRSREPMPRGPDLIPEDGATEEIWRIELPDGTEYRWWNASFIRVLEEPLMGSALEREWHSVKARDF